MNYKSVKIEPELHYKFKRMALDEDIPIQDKINTVLENYLKEVEGNIKSYVEEKKHE